MCLLPELKWKRIRVEPANRDSILFFDKLIVVAQGPASAEHVPAGDQETCGSADLERVRKGEGRGPWGDLTNGVLRQYS